MATKRSSGILLYRDRAGTTEFLLVHPGGPYWARRDDGAWSIPKGGIEGDEDSRTAALRELDEELSGVIRIVVILDQSLTDLGSCCANDWIEIHIVAWFTSERLHTNRPFLEFTPIADQRLLDGVSQKHRIALAVCK